MNKTDEQVNGKVLLGITGSVAAVLASKLTCQLMEKRFDTQVIATENSFYFTGWRGAFNVTAHGVNFNVPVLSDNHEFPNDTYERNQAIPHIDLGLWADALVIAPLDCLTLGKMSHGLPDNLLVATYMAWPREKPIILAPAMNTRMWTHPATQENLVKLRQRHLLLSVVNPVSKLLACGETGVGAMAGISDIVEAVEVALQLGRH